MQAVYHLRKVSLGLKRKYVISDDDGHGRPGVPLAFADKQLKLADEIAIYRDENRTHRLVTVREHSAGWLASLAGYQVFDQEDRLIGSFGVLPKESLDRLTWGFEQPGVGRLTGVERSAATARVRRLLSLVDVLGEIAAAVMKYHFDFTVDGKLMFSIEKPKVLDDWYRLVVRDDAINLELLFALAVTMETRQR